MNVKEALNYEAHTVQTKINEIQSNANSRGVGHMFDENTRLALESLNVVRCLQEEVIRLTKLCGELMNEQEKGRPTI